MFGVKFKFTKFFRWVWLGLPIVFGCAIVPARAGEETQAAIERAPVSSAEKDARRKFADAMGALDKKGDYPAMIAAALAWQKEHPTDANGWFVQARANYYNGDFTTAIAAWEHARTVDASLSKNAESWLQSARALQTRYGNQAPVVVSENDGILAAKQQRERAQKLLDAKDYDEIERTAAQLARSKATTYGGDWLLQLFFEGLVQSENEADWQKQRAQIQAWHSARPQSPLARAALAKSWVSGAWLARGGDFASEVPETAWTTVEQRLNKMSQVLDDGGDLAEQVKSSPLFFDVFQDWALLSGVDTESYNQLLQVQNAAHPQFWSASTRAAFRLLPRWHGEPGEWEAFAAREADRVGAAQGQETGDALYARTVMTIQRMFFRNRDIWEKTQADWPRTQRGLDVLLREFPDSLALQTTYFEMALAAKDWEKARALLPQINGKVDAQFYNQIPAIFARRRIMALEN